jgi:GR25 family glycosyltransferase involved in LPS biosynthesis
MNIHYYLIHGIDPERKPFMEDQFQRFGVPKEDTTWITYPNKHDPMPYNLSTDPNLPKGLLSCGYKHYLALKDICEKGYDYGVIMEDNIEFHGNVPDAIQRYLTDLPHDWDCLFDSDFFDMKYRGELTNDKRVYKIDVNEYSGGTKGAHFYMLTNTFAKRLYECYLPFNHAPDHHYNSIFKKLNPNIFWAEPPNVHKILRLSTWLDNKGFNANTKYGNIVYYLPTGRPKFPWLIRKTGK